MTAPAATLTAGSVGTVETRYLDLRSPVRLDCGRELHHVRVAYETYGALSPRRDNAILVCHALSGDAHAAGLRFFSRIHVDPARIRTRRCSGEVVSEATEVRASNMRMRTAGIPGEA